MTSLHQSFVEHALATSIADDCIAIVRDRTSANLRWANNTLTTNGVMHGLDVTVISFTNQLPGVIGASLSASPMRHMDPPRRARSTADCTAKGRPTHS